VRQFTADRLRRVFVVEGLPRVRDGQAMMQDAATETGSGCDWRQFAGAAW
jgi:hypothetical protein